MAEENKAIEWPGGANVADDFDFLMVGKDGEPIMKIPKEKLNEVIVINGEGIKAVAGGASSATPTILAPGPAGQNRKMEDVTGWFVNGTGNPLVATGTPWEAPAGFKNTNWWDGTAGTWSLGSSVALPKSEIENGSVTPVKTNFFEEGKNKFNPDSRTIGKILDTVTGAPTIGNSAIDTTDFIKTQNLKLAISGVGSFSRYRVICFYDTNKNYISSLTITGSGTTNASYVFDITTTAFANVKYVRISYSNSVTDYQVEFGPSASSYEPYGFNKIKQEVLPPVQLDNDSIVTDKLKDKSVVPEKTDFFVFEAGKNRFNPSDPDILTGKFLLQNGATSNNSIYNVTGYIEIPDDQDIRNAIVSAVGSASKARFVNFYNSAKVNQPSLFIESPSGGSFALPLSAKYFRVTYGNANTDYQIEFNTVATDYEPYTDQLKKYVDPNYIKFPDIPIVEDTLRVFLPKEICIATGRTIEMYHSQITWCGNIEDYHFLWSGIGKSMKRKWSCTGTVDNIGEYALRLRIYNKNNSLVYDGSTLVRIVSSVLLSAYSLSPIGDSLSNRKLWLQEVRNLSNDLISWSGTRKLSDNTLGHEGRSGATSLWYLGNNSYTFDSNGITGNDGRTQDLNPFWNPNTGDVDFNYYKSNYNQNPDGLILWLGTNGITVDPTQNALRIKTFVDKIRSTGGDAIPIFIVHTLFRGDQNGIGIQTGNDGYVANTAYKLEEDLKVFNLQERILSLFKDYSRLYLIPVSTCHDSEYNFGAVSTPVNPRASQVEYLPVEATHPQNQGYLQIADIIYSSLCANL